MRLRIHISGGAVLLLLVAGSWRLGAQTLDTAKQQFKRAAPDATATTEPAGHGPNIIDVAVPRATSGGRPATIRKGLPDAGMPAFTLPAAELDSITAYVMTLKTPAGAPRMIAGDFGAAADPAAGEQFFLGKGDCTSCHMVRGRGGILGPDLSNVGRDRTPAQLEQALRDPGAATPVTAGRGGRGGRGAAPSYRAVSVRLRNGQSIRGVAKNESAFDLQVLGTDGKLHLLLKEQ
jgi:mono/diheme cytochrome c family protein